MPTFLDVRRLVDTVVDDRKDRIRELAAVVRVEEGLRCPGTVPADTISDVFGSLLDHLLQPAANSGQSIRIGWLPTSDATRVFFLTNSGRAAGTQEGPRESPTVTTLNGSVRQAQERVRNEGGRLWTEENPDGSLTFFVLFGSLTRS